MPDEPMRLLFVNSDRKKRSDTKTLLRSRLSVDVVTAASAANTLKTLQGAKPRFNVLVVDTTFGEHDPNIEQIEHAKGVFPDLEIILRNQTFSEMRNRAREAGVFRCLEKTCNNEELVAMVRTAIYRVHEHQVTGRINKIQNQNELVREANAAICKLTSADDSAILLIEPDTGKLERYPRTDYGSEGVKYIFSERNFSRKLISKGKVITIAEIKNNKKVSSNFRATGMRSLFAAPIPGRNNNIGILFAFSRKPAHFDRYGATNPLKNISTQFGSVLSSTRALEQTRQQVDSLDELIQVGNQLTQENDLYTQCSLAWGFVSSQLNISTFLIGIYDKDSRWLEFPLVMDENRKIEVPPRKLAGKRDSWGISGQLVESGEELFWQTAEEGTKKCERLRAKPVQIGKPCQSCFYLPLRIAGEVTGIISIQSYEKNAFNPRMLNVFRAFGSLLSTSLENRRLFVAAEAQRREAESLHRAAFALSEDLELEQGLFSRLLIELQKVVPYDSASVQLLRNNQFEIIDGRGFTNLESLIGWKFPADGNNPNRRVYETRKAVIVEDVTREFPQISKPPHRAAGIRSLLGVPMFEGRRMIGMLALDKQTPGFYTLNHARLAEDFAALAALAISNAAMFKSMQLSNAYVQAAHQASLDVISPMNTSDVLHAIVEKIREQTGAGRVAAVRWEGSESPIVLAQVGFGTHSDVITHIRPNGVSAQVMRSRTPSFFPDLESVPNIHPDMPQNSVRAAACLPLVTSEGAFGVVWIHFDDKHEFPEIEQQVLTTFVNQSAAAYRHSQLFEELSKAHTEARLIAAYVARQNPAEAMQAIVRAAKNVLHCDIVTLYAYNPEDDSFGFPPALEGVKDTDSVLALRKVSRSSLVRAIIEMDEPYYCEDARADAVVHETYERREKSKTFIERENIGSFCAVPLKVGEKKVGVLFINFHAPRKREMFDEKTIQLFSDQAAITIQNAQLLEKSSDQEEVFRRILQASDNIAKTDSFEDLLRAIVEQARLLTSKTGPIAQVTYLSLVTKQKHLVTKAKHLILREGDPVEEIHQMDHRLIDIDLADQRMQGSIVMQAVEKRDSILLKDADADQRSFLVLGDKARSALSVPIIFRGGVLGVITVEHSEVGAFDDEDEAILGMLANQSSPILRNGELYQMVKDNRFFLKSIFGASSVMVSELDPRSMLDTIVDALRTAVDAWRVVAIMNDGNDEGMRVISQSGFEDPQDAQIPFRPNGVSRMVMREQKPIWAEDIRPDDTLIHPSTIREGARAAACLPLSFRKDNRNVRGVIWIHFRQPHYFSYTERDALQIYATQSALAYERALDYAELKQTKVIAGASTAVAWLGLVSSVWTHSIQKHAHAISNEVRLIRNQLAADRPDRTKLDESLRSIEYLSEKIRQKPINAPLPQEEAGDAVNVNGLIGERLLQLWTLEPNRTISLVKALELADNAFVRANTFWLKHALDILIDNAVQAVANEPDPCVKVATRRSGQRVEIIVEDNGPGIPHHLRDLLLKTPVKKEVGEKGMGVGLLIAQTIIQSYNGNVVIDYDFAGGSRVIFELPMEIVS